MQAYAQSFQFLDLSGPTYFAPLLEQVAILGAQHQKQAPNQYMVLMIITDGAIHDME